ncbi:MAG: beta-lactamase family protein [Rhodospirillaceae bacterium]|jgi:CubicO group peptidase (beta-lactamase class C family)|nr:beta-lactamase family protein [Rhodospirillaceae bacterium]MBT5566703.1 beta-lactamase family protein [Rhodospirillaceae bacterium]MBT6090754.1 beta-lactamase family protein [Rhodospirillaceae bacterium]MBT6959758.1 beta-lactamase family protein [Rhodospirillaceae bacterium]MBT7449590.1 beta-lactamase family protein [Rhodospirillaceae bacterium]
MKPSIRCVAAAMCLLGASPLAAGDWLPSGNAKRLGFDPDRLERIAPVMQAHVDEGRLSGAAMVIIRDGKIVYRDTVGYADIENETPLTEDSVFRIYSMTKAITTTAAMSLIEEGRLRLTDPVSKFIPSFADMKVYVSGEGDDMVVEGQKSPMTIHHLLTHTSGIPYGGRSPAMATYNDVNTSGATTLAELVNVISQKPLVFQPGDRWLYGLSTDVMGYVVEVVSGQPFEDFIADRITTPLGMDDTSFVLTPNLRGRVATAYEQGDGRIKLAGGLGVRSYEPEDVIPSGGGGLLSTPADYARFAQMLLNGGVLGDVRILSPRSVELMSRNHMSDEQKFSPGMGFGLGFAIAEDPGLRKSFLSEGSYSWAGAADTHFWIDPEKNLIGIAMTQIIGNSSPLRDDMRAMTYQALMD